MADPQAMVAEFHRRFGVVARERPELVDLETHRLRVALIEEELEEFHQAGESRDLVAVADSLADLLYVVYGAAVAYGIELMPIFREVHRANLTKGNPEVLRRPDGKILKGMNFTPPDIRTLVEAQVGRETPTRTRSDR